MRRLRPCENVADPAYPAAIHVAKIGKTRQPRIRHVGLGGKISEYRRSRLPIGSACSAQRICCAAAGDARVVCRLPVDR